MDLTPNSDGSDGDNKTRECLIVPEKVCSIFFSSFLLVSVTNLTFFFKLLDRIFLGVFSLHCNVSTFYLKKYVLNIESCVLFFYSLIFVSTIATLKDLIGPL